MLNTQYETQETAIITAMGKRPLAEEAACAVVVVVVVEGVVVLVVGVSSAGEPLPEEGVAEGAEALPAALTSTESFMPPLQCPGTEHMK